MRLCFVTFEYPPVTSPTTGGIGRWASALAPSMAARGHDVHVLTWGEGPDATVEQAGVTIHLRPRPTRAAGLPLARTVESALVPGLLVRRSVSALGAFDLVVAPEWGGDAWMYAVDRRSGPLLTQLAGSRAVLAPYLAKPDTWRESVHGRLQNARERLQTTRSDAVGSCSNALLARTSESWTLDRERTFVVPNSIDIRRVRMLADSTAPALPPGRAAVAFVGRLEHLKGVHVLVQAMRMVRTAHENVELLLIGADTAWRDGPELASVHLRHLAGEFASRIHIIGELAQPALFSTMKRASVVVAPSLWESFGLVALEAMAVGTPVIATTGNGFSEFIRDGVDGLLVAPGEPRALASAIERMLEDEPLRVSIGGSAARQAENFDVSRVAAIQEHHYTTIAARSSPPNSHPACSASADRPSTNGSNG